MTRFARASGSKGANERRPEEATSWQEMKSNMVVKSNKTDVPSENTLGDQEEVPTAEEIKSVWASLVADSDSKKKKKKKDKLIKKGIQTNDNVEGSDDTPIIKKKKLKRRLDDEESEKNEIAPLKKKSSTKIESKVNGKDSLKSGKVLKKKKKKYDVQFENEAESHSEIPAKKKVKKHDVQSEIAAESCVDIVPKKKKKLGKRQREVIDESPNKNNNEQPPVKTHTVQKPRVKGRRKEALKEEELMINGKPVKVAPFDGFLVQADDAKRLRDLRQNMKNKGIPDEEREKAIKLERRRAEKALARLRKKVCFHCRAAGHNLSECPKIQEDQRGANICYKCGSTEHTYFQCKVTRKDDFRFAECFICKEQGHIAKQCPDNPRGLYPKGGACIVCGDVTHLKKDCPKHLETKEEEGYTAWTHSGSAALEGIEEDFQGTKATPPVEKRLNKHIKF